MSGLTDGVGVLSRVEAGNSGLKKMLNEDDSVQDLDFLPEAETAQNPPSREGCVASTAAASSPTADSPPPAVGVALRGHFPEAGDTEQNELPLESRLAGGAAVVKVPTASSAACVAVATVVPCEEAEQPILNVLCEAAAADAAVALACAPAAADCSAVAASGSSADSALRAWESAKAAAASAASVAATTVAATDLSGLTGATASLLAAASNGLGTVRKTSSGLLRGRGGAAATSNDTEAADATQSPGSAGACHEQSSGSTGRGFLLGHFNMPGLPQWLCSPTTLQNSSLGCLPSLADKDTELEGSEAEAAAAAHLAAVTDPSAGIGANQFNMKQPVLNNAQGQGLLTYASEGLAASAGTATPATAGNRGAAGPAGSLETGLPRERSTLACTSTQNEDSTVTLSARGDKEETGGRCCNAGASSEAERVLQLLQERAACAAALSDCGSNPAEELDTCELEHQLLQLQEATEAVLAAGPSLLQQAELEAISPEEVAATAERAQRALKEQKQTGLASLLSSIAESSRRSVKAVKRVAGAAASSSTGVIGPASSGSSLYPLFGACTTSRAQAHEGAELAKGEEGIQERQGETAEASEALQSQAEGSGQSDSGSLGSDAARLGLLLALQQRQQAIAEVLRQRSANLLEHSVALTTSSSLSEARYHLAEIVDTGGPEVSGVWAGFKVGLGIVTLASGHLLLGGAMVAVATGSLGSAVMWSRHRRLFYDMMRGNFSGNEEQPEAAASPEAADADDKDSSARKGTNDADDKPCGQDADTCASSIQGPEVSPAPLVEVAITARVEAANSKPLVRADVHDGLSGGEEDAAPSSA